MSRPNPTRRFVAAALVSLGCALPPVAARAQGQTPPPPPSTPVINPIPAAAPQTPAPLPAVVPPLVVPPPLPVAPYTPFPNLPVPPLDEAHNGIGLAQKQTRAKGQQARLLWIDGTANLDRVNTDAKIVALVGQIKAAGFNTIVFEGKPIIGYTLYPSKYAPKLTQWPPKTAPGEAPKRTLPLEFDPLAVFAREARAQGVSLLVNFNAFSEGHRDFQMGPGYDHADWQTVLYEEQPVLRVGAIATFAPPVAPPVASPLSPLATRTDELPPTDDEIAVYRSSERLLADLPKRNIGDAVVVIADAQGRVVAQIAGIGFAALGVQIPTGGAAFWGAGKGGAFLRREAVAGGRLFMESAPAFVPIGLRPRRQVPLMTNPFKPEVQQRLLDMLTEVATNYDIDGVTFDDRLRFSGLDGDFSPEGRAAFETWLGKTIRWPDDVFRYRYTFPTLDRNAVPGPYYDSWLVFRALTIRNFLASAVATVKIAKPKAVVGTYVGSWYPDYPDVGANWAADDLGAGFRFLSDSYRKTGWAGLADFVTTGCYYQTATIQEAAAKGTPVGETVEAAGQFSNRAVNDQTFVYAGISLDQFKNRPDDLKRVLQAACAATQGVMVFDLSHNIEPFWPVFTEAFAPRPAVPPHLAPGALADLRQSRAAQKATGHADPPVILYRGASGTGF